MKIIVGTLNPAKIEAARLAASAYYGENNFDIEGFKADPGVPDMPTTEQEMIDGALNRARAAVAQGADIGIGLEGGTYESEWGMFMTGWSAVVTKDGQESLARDGTMPMPKHWQDAIRNGEELRPFMKASGLPYNEKDSAVGFLTKGVLPREYAMTFGLKMALAPIANPQAYIDPLAQTA